MKADVLTRRLTKTLNKYYMEHHFTSWWFYGSFGLFYVIGDHGNVVEGSVAAVF